MAGLALIPASFVLLEGNAILGGLVLAALLLLAAVFANRMEGEFSATKEGLKINLAKVVQTREVEVIEGKVVDIKNVMSEIDPIIPSGSIEPSAPGEPSFSKVLPYNTRIELTRTAQEELRNFFPDDARAIIEGLLHLPAALETKDGIRLIEQPTSVDYYTYSPVAGVQVSFRQVDGKASDGKTTYVVLSVIPQSD